ncbi:aminotransferase class I/II-fold pyridoxal phosphate-dependent enzyme [Thermoleophilia bacterium SCSIO 60948]|nr:aminotransferase class I/II-fold pyridoxal phosphate-dependent enzyme [Thermoleophilia bacterium SCSIO 60948]
MRSEGTRFAGRGTAVLGGPGAADIRRVIDLRGDDPLGLGDHPRVRRAAGEAAERYGTSARAGDEPPGALGVRLERTLAELLGGERTFLFGSGSEAARAAVIGSATRSTLVAIDERASSGLADGARASGAEILGYRHLDVGQLATALRSARRRNVVIATDSVFASTGASAPLSALSAVAERTGARLVIDESEAIGVRSSGGRGLAAEAGIAAGPKVALTGSLGGALGSQGGFACASGSMLAAIAERTAWSTERPAPPACGAALAALGLLADSPGLLSALERNAGALRDALADQGFEVDDDGGHVVSVGAGDSRRAAALAERALSAGVAIEALWAPFAAARSSRVRLRARASHRTDELCSAARILGQAAREVGIIGPVAGRLASQPSARAA